MNEYPIISTKDAKTDSQKQEIDRLRNQIFANRHDYEEKFKEAFGQFTSTIEDKDQRIKELENELSIARTMRDSVSETCRIKDIEIERLRCCGTCSEWDWKFTNSCSIDLKTRSTGGSCKKWKPIPEQWRTK